MSKSILALVMVLAMAGIVISSGEPSDMRMLTRTELADLGKTPGITPQVVGAIDPQLRAKVQQSFGKLPLLFEPNRGQFDPRVSFAVKGRDMSVYFTSQGLTYVLTAPKEKFSKKESIRSLREIGERQADVSTTRQSWVLKQDFVGARQNVKPESLEETQTIISYFKGKKEDWKTGIKVSSKIVYRDLWPGIDLVYTGTVNRMKYEFNVHPGADPKQIRLAYRGADKVALNQEGLLEITTPLGGFTDDTPMAWQGEGTERREVCVAYALDDDPAVGSCRYGFSLGEYDRAKSLVLDPAVLVYCGYIGGSSGASAYGIAVDQAGCAYVAGSTSSYEATFPVTGGPDLTANGSVDAFVAKVNASGTALLYCGYIGGSDDDHANSIAVDQAGCAYVAGSTGNTINNERFPVTGGLDPTYNGGTSDAFVAKVNASGTALAYCGYIGGANADFANSIAVDQAGCAYVAGHTGAVNGQVTSFPVTGGPDLTLNGNGDAFVAKVNASGTALLYCGYIGGSNDYEEARGIAVDQAGCAYVAGHTNSTEATFPVLGGPDLTHNGGVDAFVAKVNASGKALVYCGYIGGANDDFAYGIAVDQAGCAYVAGHTGNTEGSFPVTGGPDLTVNGDVDAFVAKVNASGTALAYCGYIGGSSYDSPYGIAVDQAGCAYVAGFTYSDEASFPVTGGLDPTYNGGTSDAFVAKVNASGTALAYCGYIGGSGDDIAYGIAVDQAGCAYVAGHTGSTEGSFPVTGGPDLTLNGNVDAFVAKVDYTLITISGNVGITGATLSYTDGSAKTATADGSGNYSFTVSNNWSGTVTPILAGYTFNPASRTYTSVSANQASQNYTATRMSITTSVAIMEINPNLSPISEEVEENATTYRFYNIVDQNSVPLPKSSAEIALVDDEPNNFLSNAAFTAQIGENGALAIGVNNALNTGDVGSMTQLSFPATIKIGTTAGIPITVAPPSFQIKKVSSNYYREFTFFAKGSAGVSGGIGALGTVGAGKVSLQLAKLSVSGEGGFGIHFEVDKNNEITKMWRQFDCGLKGSIAIPEIEADVSDIIKAKASLELGVAVKPQYNNTIDLTRFNSTQRKVVAAGFLIESFANSGSIYAVTTRLILKAINYWLSKTYGTLLNQARFSESYGIGLEGGLAVNASVDLDTLGFKANSGVKGSVSVKNTTYAHESTKERSIEMGYTIDSSVGFSNPLAPDFFELSQAGIGLQSSNTYSLKWQYDSNTGIPKEFSLKMEPSANAGVEVTVFKGSTYTGYPSEFKFTDAQVLSQFKEQSGLFAKILAAGVIGNEYIGIDPASVVTDLQSTLLLAKTLAASQQLAGFEKTTGINRGRVYGINKDISLGAGVGLNLEVKLGLNASYTQEASQDLYKSIYFKDGYFLRKSLVDQNIQPDASFVTNILENSVFSGLTTILREQIDALKDEIVRTIASVNEVIQLTQNGVKTLGTFATNGINTVKIFVNIFSSKLKSLVGGANSSLCYAKFETPYLQANMRRNELGEMELSGAASTILSIVSKSFVIEAQDGSGVVLTSFPTPQTLTLKIEETDLNESGFSLADASKLKLYRCEPTTQIWSEVVGATNNGSEVAAQISTTGIYALGIENTVDLTADPDNDGLTIAQEDKNANGLLDQDETDPYNPDTDGDGYTDGFETSNGSNPLDVNSVPTNFSLTLGNTTGGLVEPQAGTANYLAGNKVELIARSLPGYVFNGWSGGISSTSNPITVTMDGDKTITANFVLEPTTTVTSPNGGEAWTANTSHNVTWTSTGSIASVQIDYSTDSGSSWTPVIASTTNDGSYSWTVPGTPAANCLVRVADAANAAITDQSNASFSIVSAIPPAIGLNHTRLNFGKTGAAVTSAQTLRIHNTGGGTLNWTATASAGWIVLDKASGSGNASIQVAVNPAGLGNGSYSGTITVADPAASNSPQTVTVTLVVKAKGAAPSGLFETPSNNATGVTGSIAVTGWAVDDVEVTAVKIYRNPLAGEGTAPVYLGDACLVEGARPDVESLYATTPFCYRAGWGYMLLTNFLPAGGNGTFTLYAYAVDRDGHSVQIGSKRITCDNAHATLPFGAIDTPSQGGAASGSSYVNFGWALTPQPGTIPVDGSTLWVWVDGAPLGHPTYDQYREDIATLFPGYANSDGAVGFYYLAPAALAEGVHTIAWSVRDDLGREDGIGSRYFSVSHGESFNPLGIEGNNNDSPLVKPPTQWAVEHDESSFQMGTPIDSEDSSLGISPTQWAVSHGEPFGLAGAGGVGAGFKPAPTSGPTNDSRIIDLSFQSAIDTPQPLRVRRGFAGTEETLYPDREGVVEIAARPCEPLAIELDPDRRGRFAGHERVGDDLRPLPIGARLDPDTGVFTWLPGPGFAGCFSLEFVASHGSDVALRYRCILRIHD